MSSTPVTPSWPFDESESDEELMSDGSDAYDSIPDLGEIMDKMGFKKSDFEADTDEDERADTVTDSGRSSAGGLSETHPESDDGDATSESGSVMRLDDEQHFYSLDQVESFRATSGEIIRASDIVSIETEPELGEWIGRVKDIRLETDEDAERNSQKTWVKINWFYSVPHFQESMVDGLVKAQHLTFDPKSCGEDELIETPDHEEIYVSSLVKGIAKLYSFRDAEERDVNEPPLPEGTPFSRIVFYFHKYRGDKAQVVPTNRCRCGLAVEAKSPRKSKAKPRRLTDKLAMAHFCPQPQCLRWMHRECLNDVPGAIIYNDVGPKLAGNKPETIDISAFMVDSPDLPQSTVPEYLPPLLERIASQPIVRDKNRPFGNRQAVCTARALLPLARPESVGMVNWDAVVQSDMIQQALNQPASEHEAPESCFRCPFCKGAGV